MITDVHFSPVPGITFQPEDGKTGTVTNLHGEYSLSVPPGELVLVIRGLGFQPQRKRISIGGLARLIGKKRTRENKEVKTKY